MSRSYVMLNERNWIPAFVGMTGCAGWIPCQAGNDKKEHETTMIEAVFFSRFATSRMTGELVGATGSSSTTTGEFGVREMFSRFRNKFGMTTGGAA